MKPIFSILLMLICWGCKAQDSGTIHRDYDSLNTPYHFKVIEYDESQTDSTEYYTKKFKYFMDKYTKERNFKEIQRYVDSAIHYRELIDHLKK